MKELHMICNAHLDPVWLWQKPEGIAFKPAAEAASTEAPAAAPAAPAADVSEIDEIFKIFRR